MRRRELTDRLDQSQPDPSAAVQRDDIKRLITCGCTGPERLTLILFYYEGLTLAEIGQLLGFSEAHVGRIHARLLARVRERLAGREGEFTDLGAAET